jgi:hypothetical protein
MSVYFVKVCVITIHSMILSIDSLKATVPEQNVAGLSLPDS